MKIILNHSSNEESNLYLRCLYANLRRVFGKCAWFFNPSKHGESQSIRVGSIDLGKSYPTQTLSIKYAQKGVIKELELSNTFEPNDKGFDQELYEIASTVVVTDVEDFVVFAILDTIDVPMANYCSDYFSLTCDENGKNLLSVKVSAFDDPDAAVLAGKFINRICDFLSVSLNTYVRAANLTICKNLPYVTNDELFSGSLDWIDDHPCVSEKLTLAKYQVLIIDDILQERIKLTFLNACSHFNNAANLLKSYSTQDVNLIDTAAVLYVSALEVCSSIFPYDNTTCSECSQKVFSIRRRVLELVKIYYPEHLVKFIDKYYQERSKYLHAGSFSSSGNYYGLSIPQLDPNSESGCHMQVSVLPLNLRDFTSFIFRKISQDRELINN
ncbi:hypothetical protein Q9F31_000355 [Vibrio alginolyticus]|uniref:hypothetical protein n=1 Tax=Vibrio alginolyticus TaxID=663 RepID=UPI0023D8BB1E|nr:hypothetical protein [Vibrio alginolyticus]ELA7385320.1 hypothetical protein [Vibrio alginolyticus]WEK79841.1 hypothetical protein PY250_06250 [Vibrio alginolyticus]